MAQRINTYYVYKHTCPNGKVYIGVTSRTPRLRWGNNGYCYRKQIFYRAIQKYGWDNIEHEILAVGLSAENAHIAEKKLIKRYKSRNPKYGYNQSVGGECGNKGAKFSDETRAKMAEAHKGKASPRPDGWINPMIGRHLSEETRRKISETRTGKKYAPLTEETKRKISEAQLGEKNHMYGRRLTSAEKEKMSLGHKRRMVRATNVETNEINIFNGLRPAERETGTKHSNIIKYINTGKQLNGYIWEDVI